MDRARCSNELIWPFISALDALESIRAEVQTGRETISGGKSHSCERPTSWPAQHKAHTISVQLGSSDTILFLLIQNSIHARSARRASVRIALSRPSLRHRADAFAAVRH